MEIKALTATLSVSLTENIDDYPEGIIVPVDKPYRWTSADAVRKIKFAAARHFRKKNLKVGHAGTLDPLATGVLVICIGKATKLAETLQSHDKEYIAEITFGATTPSYDLEKEIDRFFPYEHITRQEVENALGEFLGEQEQIAPLFSAKSVEGVRAYELARKLYRESLQTADGHGNTGKFDDAAEKLIRTARITISEIELLSFGMDSGETGNAGRKTGTGASSRINVTDNSSLALPKAVIRIACSKGTYIRAFARDLGERLGSGAYLSGLKRSRSGIFRADEALSMEQAANLFKGNA